MQLKKIAQDTNNKINQLLGDCYHKSQLYDEITKYVSKVLIQVKDVSLFANNDGLVGVKVEYDVPTVKIYFDDDGQILKNDRFYAMNYLNLISTDDMKRIQVYLDDAKRRNLK